eukprot:jgi/Chlat1/8916/Chrsp92S08215
MPLVAKKVLYCGVCGLPPEFCEFGPDFEKCKPWLRKHVPELYPELSTSGGGGGGDGASNDGGVARDGGALPATSLEENLRALSVADGKPSSSGKDADSDVIRLPGGKVKKKEAPEVVIEIVTRNKRKHVTVVKGLDGFGVKLSDAAKKFGKKFACGASVVKDATGKDQIDVQGDYLVDITEFIVETWKSVPDSAMYWVENGRKEKAEL